MAIGVKALQKYNKGEPLSMKQSVYAKCAECMGSFEDGACDCEVTGCPLYPYMPYGTIKKKKAIKMDKESVEKRKERGKQLATGRKKRLSESSDIQ